MIQTCSKCKNYDISISDEPCRECQKAFRRGEGKPNFVTVLTNSDRIRSMTDEELAEFMCHNVSNGTVNCAFCAAAEFCRMGHNGWLDWLKGEAKNG